jgi:hypothetical protein
MNGSFRKWVDSIIANFLKTHIEAVNQAVREDARQEGYGSGFATGHRLGREEGYGEGFAAGKNIWEIRDSRRSAPPKTRSSTIYGPKRFQITDTWIMHTNHPSERWPRSAEATSCVSKSV